MSRLLWPAVALAVGLVIIGTGCHAPLLVGLGLFSLVFHESRPRRA